jgi:hypothetical protein
MARKIDEAANFVFMQLIEQEPGIYDKRHHDYARWYKIDLALERIARNIEGVWYVCIRIYIIKLIIGSKYRICLLKQ